MSNFVPADGLELIGAGPSAAAVMTKFSFCMFMGQPVNTLRPRQHEHHVADNIFKYIFLNENV